MKKIFILLTILFITTSVSNGQFTKLGGGLGFTSGYPFHNVGNDYNKSGHIYASAKGIIELSLPFHISPSVTFFLPHITKTGDAFSQSTYTVSTLMFDINGHYVVNSLDRFEFYALAGFDILLAWKKEIYKTLSATPFTETRKEQDNALGLNIGAGANMKITEQIDLFAEAKYVIYGKDKLFFSNYNQFMVTAGALINLRWLAKNENPKM
jgi:opacity protein-like surface antigen